MQLEKQKADLIQEKKDLREDRRLAAEKDTANANYEAAQLAAETTKDQISSALSGVADLITAIDKGFTSISNITNASATSNVTLYQTALSASDIARLANQIVSELKDTIL